MKITPPSSYDEVKEMIMGMKNNQAAVQTICRERGLNTVGMRQKKKQMPEILNKM